MDLIFEENCRCLRNSRVIDIIRELVDYGVRANADDPWADPNELAREWVFRMAASFMTVPGAQRSVPGGRA
jgi:UDP-N-acetyl-D-mannosaminuronate dehydrogenase